MDVIVNNDKIRFYMLETQQDKFTLARKCQLSCGQISDLLNKRHRCISIDTVIKFCQGTGLSFKDIFTIDKIKSKKEQHFIDVMTIYLDEYRKARL